MLLKVNTGYWTSPTLSSTKLEVAPYFANTKIPYLSDFNRWKDNIQWISEITCKHFLYTTIYEQLRYPL